MHHAVVHVPFDGAVMHEPAIGYAGEPLLGFLGVDADRLFTEVAAGGHDRKAKFSHEQMMQRIRRQHHAMIGILRRNVFGN